MQNDTLHLDELNLEQTKQLICTLQADNETLQTDKKVLQADNETLHETLLKAVKKIDALSNQVAALQKLLFGKNQNAI